MRLFVGVPVPVLDLGGTGIPRAEEHLTLAFLGEIDPGREEAVMLAVGSALEGVVAFPVEFRGVGAFPSTASPRVMWIGTAAGSEPLIAIARRLHGRLRDAGFVSDDRPLVPHVTLFRVRSPGDSTRARQLLRDHTDRVFGAARVQVVTLWESQWRATGAVHLPRRSWTLGEAATERRGANGPSNVETSHRSGSSSSF
ncbi:MAG: RNA 2',3'-cyclic phosphodiesterase [Thermoplasmata archaeon]|nr:RNA 2',3'-cyclic phosphodiesterase [Thermoplasmata archaeon]